MTPHRLLCFALVVACCGAPYTALGQCRVDDESFDSQDGGCKDLATGLVWSVDLRALGYNYPPNANAWTFCEEFFNDDADAGGGFTDWRVPTIGEAQEALANGLYTHNDYFGDGSPGIHSYYWSSCHKYFKKKYQGTYAIRHQDGAIRLSTRAENALVCVRGAAADPVNDCPANPKPGGVKGTNAAWLPRPVTGALLTLPLTMMAAVWGLRRRWT